MLLESHIETLDNILELAPLSTRSVLDKMTIKTNGNSDSEKI